MLSGAARLHESKCHKEGEPEERAPAPSFQRGKVLWGRFSFPLSEFFVSNIWNYTMQVRLYDNVSILLLHIYVVHTEPTL